MNEILIMLSTLLCCHFLLDFAIQGDFVAKFKTAEQAERVARSLTFDRVSIVKTISVK